MTTHRTLSALTLATAAVVLMGPSPTYAKATADGATTERERGIVLECTGEAGGLQAYANVYENDTYGNYFQVVLGAPDDGNGRSKEPQRPMFRDGVIRATITIDGQKAKVRGTAKKVGKKTPSHMETDDAGYHVSSHGTHRRLANDLVLSYDGTTVPLTCDPAFAYDLKVTKAPIV